MPDSNRPISQFMIGDDHKFLMQTLAQLPLKLKKKIKEKYKMAFLAGMDSEQVFYRKNNAGRKRANLYLLKILEKINEFR